MGIIPMNAIFAWNNVILIYENDHAIAINVSSSKKQTSQ